MQSVFLFVFMNIFCTFLNYFYIDIIGHMWYYYSMRLYWIVRVFKAETEKKIAMFYLDNRKEDLK